VCERWLGENGWPNFLADMGKRPGPKFTLERINNELGYFPGNCRWATYKEQLRNTRNTRFLTLNGRTMCVTDWASESGLERVTLFARLRKGWSVEKALTTPVKKYKPRTRKAVE
jgi:hypothetical protein